MGLKFANSDILVYADDDIEAFPTWLEGIAEAFEDKDVVLVGGKNLPKFESEPPDWISKMWEKDENGNRMLGYLSILDLGDEIKTINPFHVFGCNFAVRKQTLLDAGGFHPDAFPQELIRFRGDGESHVSSFIKSKGYKAVYNPKASVYHCVPNSRMTVEYFCRRAYNQGISDSYTAIRRSKDRVSNKIGFNKLSELKRRAEHFLEQVKEKPFHEIPGVIGRRMKGYASKCLKIRTYPPPKNLLDENALTSAIHLRISQSYKEGCTFHQKEITEDPQLFKWVLKRDYWDSSPLGE